MSVSHVHLSANNSTFNILLQFPRKTNSRTCFQTPTSISIFRLINGLLPTVVISTFNWFAFSCQFFENASLEATKPGKRDWFTANFEIIVSSQFHYISLSLSQTSKTFLQKWIFRLHKKTSCARKSCFHVRVTFLIKCIELTKIDNRKLQTGAHKQHEETFQN